MLYSTTYLTLACQWGCATPATRSAATSTVVSVLLSPPEASRAAASSSMCGGAVCGKRNILLTTSDMLVYITAAPYWWHHSGHDPLVTMGEWGEPVPPGQGVEPTAAQKRRLRNQQRLARRRGREDEARALAASNANDGPHTHRTQPKRLGERDDGIEIQPRLARDEWNNPFWVAVSGRQLMQYMSSPQHQANTVRRSPSCTSTALHQQRLRLVAVVTTRGCLPRPVDRPQRRRERAAEHEPDANGHPRR